tara:strand:- start:338 stop:535 length:198 start_codon:yes stop_codon:yes gene_type:complete
MTQFLGKATSGSAEIAAHAGDISRMGARLVTVVVGRSKGLSEEVCDVRSVDHGTEGERVNCRGHR